MTDESLIPETIEDDEPSKNPADAFACLVTAYDRATEPGARDEIRDKIEYIGEMAVLCGGGVDDVTYSRQWLMRGLPELRDAYDRGRIKGMLSVNPWPAEEFTRVSLPWWKQLTLSGISLIHRTALVLNR